MGADDNRVQRFGWPTVIMLTIIMLAITLIFFFGLRLMTGKGVFEASDIVAVISPVLTAIGTVAAGVFGYSMGSESASEAQRIANKASQETINARKESTEISEFARPLAVSVRRIIDQARGGSPKGAAKHEISEDDMRTLEAMSDDLSRKIRT